MYDDILSCNHKEIMIILQKGYIYLGHGKNNLILSQYIFVPNDQLDKDRTIIF